MTPVLPAHLAADVTKRCQLHAAVTAALASQASPQGYASFLYLPMESSGHLIVWLNFSICVNASVHYLCPGEHGGWQRKRVLTI